LEDDEDWHDEKNWYKANPSLGQTIDIERVREHYHEAMENPAEEAVFKQLRLNMWVSSTTAFIPEQVFDQGNEPIDLDSLEGKGVLRRTRSFEHRRHHRTGSDVSAEDENGEIHLPAVLLGTGGHHSDPGAKGICSLRCLGKQGYMKATEGNVIDYNFIEKFILDLYKIYNIKEIAVDRWNATQLIINLQDDGLTMVPFGQGFKDMSAPTKEFYKLMMEGKIIHGGNPVLRWMALNVVVDRDAADNIKPTKAKSPEKIDGIVASIMALDRCVEVDRDENGEIYYIYHAYTNEVPGDQNKDLYFRRDEIFHVPGLGFNGLVGFSPIAMMKNALGTTLAVEKYGSAFFRNGAQPSGVLEHPGVLKNPEKIRENWSDTYGGTNNAHKVAVLEEGMTYKPISLPPEDSQFLSVRQFSVEEICRIFRVPPHMVQDLDHATFSNIEHQSIDFVVHTLTPWLVRIEQAIEKDLLLEEEQDRYFPKFNVDGLLRGDYQSRMSGYATGISNGFLSPNDVHRLENMDLIPAEKGGDDYYLNGGYVRLEDAGKFAGDGNAGTKSPEDEPETENKTKEARPPRRKR
jgi:HK97 family phage portal protein